MRASSLFGFLTIRAPTRKPSPPTPARARAAPPAIPSPAPASSALASTIAQAVASERDRIRAILNHPAAWGQADLARHLALNTDLPAQSACTVLAAAPVPPPPLAARMTPYAATRPGAEPAAGRAPAVARVASWDHAAASAGVR
jgi:hypothetical protein